MTKADRSVLDDNLVSGPASSVNGYIATFDGITGKLLAEKSVNDFARFDAPQSKTALEKYQVLQNIGSAWEHVSTVLLASDAASIDWTGLSAYRELRLVGHIAPDTSDTHLGLRFGSGGVFDSSSNYTYQYLRANGAVIDAGAASVSYGLMTATAGGNALSSRGLQVNVNIFEFNTTNWARFRTEWASRNGAGSHYVGQVAGELQQTTAHDRLQIFPSGGLIQTGSRITLEGLRG